MSVIFVCVVFCVDEIMLMFFFLGLISIQFYKSSRTTNFIACLPELKSTLTWDSVRLFYCVKSPTSTLYYDIIWVKVAYHDQY